MTPIVQAVNSFPNKVPIELLLEVGGWLEKALLEALPITWSPLRLHLQSGFREEGFISPAVCAPPLAQAPFNLLLQLEHAWQACRGRAAWAKCGVSIPPHARCCVKLSYSTSQSFKELCANVFINFSSCVLAILCPHLQISLLRFGSS